MSWSLFAIGEVAEVVSGYGFPREEQGVANEEYPFFKVSDMNTPGNEKELSVPQHTISEGVLKKLRAKPFPPGTTVFPKIGAAIATNKKRMLVRPSVVDNNVMGIIPNGKLLDPWFLYYWLQQFDLQQAANIGPVPSIRKTEFERIQVPVPPLPEQRRIVEILDQADALRKKRAEADAKAARILPALFYEMFGDPATNPKGWPIRRFESICDSRLGKMLDAKQQTGEHQRPYLRNANVYWDHLELDSILEMDFDEADRDEFRLKKGDVLICEGGEVGRCAIWNDDLPECYFQKALHRARPMEGAATPEFVLYLLRELAQNGSLLDAVSKMTFAHLTGVKLKALRIPVPPVSLQEKFSSHVRVFKEARKSGETARNEVDRLFLAVVHRAFSGDLTAKWREANKTELVAVTNQQANASGASA